MSTGPETIVEKPDNVSAPKRAPVVRDADVGTGEVMVEGVCCSHPEYPTATAILRVVPAS